MLSCRACISGAKTVVAAVVFGNRLISVDIVVMTVVSGDVDTDNVVSADVGDSVPADVVIILVVCCRNCDI